MEPDSSAHDLSAVPDGEHILVSCSCGWQVWSRTRPTPATLQLAVAQVGGKHLAHVNEPTPPRREVVFAVAAFGVMVCVTVVAVVLIWTW